jgi:fructose-1-phosphate kinase PfkB-like protein
MARRRPAWVAGCGSLPPGFHDDFYLRLALSARQNGARFVADCDGAALHAVAQHCDLLVPNAHEAARLTGKPIDGVDDAAHAALALRDRGTALVAITLGPAGAVLAAADGVVVHARPPAQTGTSAVGAGDAFLAALLLALAADQHVTIALRDAVAAGTAVLASTGSGILDPPRYHAIRDRIVVGTIIGSVR